MRLRKRQKLGVALTVALLALVGAGAPASPVSAASVPPLDHLFVVVMENHGYGEIIGSASAPYTNSLSRQGAVATQYYAVAHPSLPNYLALTGASTFGVGSDCTTCWVSAANIADRLESAGSTWKTYQESMPSACFVGDSYPYAQKHNPFLYYNDIRTNSSRCAAHVVPYTQLGADLSSTSTTPNFAFITPNMCNDMHDSCNGQNPIAAGDAWLQQQVPTILRSPAFTTQRSVLAIAWDEDDSSGSNQVPMILLGSGVGVGSRSSASYNHYSLVRTIEAARGLATLTANDANAASIGDLFTVPVTPPSTSACTTVSLSMAPGSPQAVGTQIQLTATAAGCLQPRYQFWVLAPGSSTWQITQPYATSPTLRWSTASMAAGTYRITVWARDATSTGVNANSAGSWDASANTQYALNLPNACATAGLGYSPASSAVSGTRVSVAASAGGCANPTFEFWMLSPATGAWRLAQPYSSSSTLSWGTLGAPAGIYRITVWVRDASSSGAYRDALGTWDASSDGSYTLTSNPCSSAAGAVAPSPTATVGTTLTLSASSSGCLNPGYQFWVLAPNSGTWEILRPYSSVQSFSWDTTGRPAGTYRITVWVRDASSAGTQSSSAGSWDASYNGVNTLS